MGNRASHNLIHDGPRMGIMFSGNNLVIEYNHIRHVNLETEDTGAVYTGGRDWISSRGTVIRYNYFHDILGYGQDQNGNWVSPHFAWGVYLDDNAGGVDVIGNIVAALPRRWSAPAQRPRQRWSRTTCSSTTACSNSNTAAGGSAIRVGARTSTR